MNNEVPSRIHTLSKTLSDKGADVALIMQNIDMYYYSGTIPSGVLAISSDNKTVYAIKRGYLRAQKETPIDSDNIAQIKGFSELPTLFSQREIKFNTIGIEMDVVPTDIFFKLKKTFKDSNFIDISFDIRWQRSEKSAYEINKMKEAARMLDCTIEDAKELIEPDKKEIDISAELEFRARKRGHQGYCRMRGFNGEVFMGHIHSGPRSAYPSGYLKPTAGIGPYATYPEGASFEKIRKNEPIIVDFLGNYQGYMSDETRIFSIGKLDKKFEKAYNFCKDMIEWLEETAKPEMIAGEIYENCLIMADRAGYKDNFMGIVTNQTPFVGHGVGLELDEFPFIAKGQNYPIKENMTFAFEPKIAFKNEGAIGIENTYLVTKEGVKSFNHFPREIVYL